MSFLSAASARRLSIAVMVSTLLIAQVIPLALKEAGAQPSTVVVTTLADSPTPGAVTLRQAIATVAPGGTITFSNTILPGKIHLASGELVIDKSLTILGPGKDVLAIVGSHAPNNSFRVLRVVSGVTVAIEGVSIQDGLANEGAGIRNAGTLTVKNSQFLGNLGEFGGGIHNAGGSLTIIASDFDENGSVYGAGIYAAGGSTLVNDSKFFSNEADFGAAIFNDDGSVSVLRAALYGNLSLSSGVVVNAGQMVIDETIFHWNEAITYGGAILNAGGTLSLNESILSENAAGDAGSAMFVDSGNVTINTTHIQENSTLQGTVYLRSGNLDIHGGTISVNVAFNGSGLYVESGTAHLTGSTIVGNKATFGGGVYLYDGTLDIVNSTLSSNDAASTGGAIYAYQGDISITSSTLLASAIWRNAGEVTVATSILAGEPSTSDACDAYLTSGGYNLVSDASCFDGNDASNEVYPLATLMLDDLDENGGPWRNLGHMPLPGSPALDRVPTANCLDTDMRGVPRPQGAACDVGALEYVDLATLPPPVLHLPGPVNATTTNPAGAPVTFVVSATDWVGNDVEFVCTFESGALFPLGTTSVFCSAGDTWGKSTTGRFTVSVTQQSGGGNGPGGTPTEPGGSDLSAFDRVWTRTDQPVASGQAARTWVWGPAAFGGPLVEDYVEAPGGKRTVLYHETSRMEISDPSADPNSIWYVTNGLLVVEMITGNMQVGHNTFEMRPPAEVVMAGDIDDQNGPTYKSFSGLSFPGYTANARTGEVVVERIQRDGSTSYDAAFATRGVTLAYFDAITGHNIAAPFWEFMHSSGMVIENGQLVSSKLFPDPFYATGRPITEPYWATVLVGGTPKDVLMQCFERRCLTYTPDNPAGWRVEAGNVGLHYYNWRYQAQ